MAHFNFVISQNATWGHADFYIDRHWIELNWSRKMRLLSVFYFSFEISIACWLLSRPNLRTVVKLTTDIVTYRYCTEASNQKSKYAYRKIFFYKKSTGRNKRLSAVDTVTNNLNVVTRRWLMSADTGFF